MPWRGTARRPRCRPPRRRPLCRWQVVGLGPPQGWASRRGPPPGPGRGIRLSLEKARTQRVAGGGPRPLFRARSFPLARFGVVGHSGTVEGLVRSPGTCPDLETFFRKNACSAYFLLENASQIGLSIPEEIALRTDQDNHPKNQRVGTSGYIKRWGVQGHRPPSLFSPFLGRNGDPCRVGGGPRALRPKGASEAPTRKGTYPPAPTCGPLDAGPNGITCRWQSRPRLEGHHKEG